MIARHIQYIYNIIDRYNEFYKELHQVYYSASFLSARQKYTLNVTITNITIQIDYGLSEFSKELLKFKRNSHDR